MMIRFCRRFFNLATNSSVKKNLKEGKNHLQIAYSSSRPIAKTAA
jgi:hypothetical protein